MFEITKTKLLIAICGLIFSIFAWKILTTGKITVQYLPPYEISSNEKTLVCSSDTCKITLPKGSQTITVNKEGYISGQFLVEVKSFGNAVLQPILKKLPTITPSAKKYPQSSPLPVLDLVVEGDSQLLKSTLSNQPLAVFPQPLINAKIINDDNFALISSDQGHYLLNLKTSERKKIPPTPPSLTFFLFAPTGKYMAYRKENETLYLHDFQSGENFPTDIKAANEQLAWSSNNLIFATNQNYQNLEDKPHYNQIILTKSALSKIIFGYLESDTKKYFRILESGDLKSTPTDFILPASARELYFKSENEVFRINLE